MCSSWLPSASKSQESSFEISSIVRSLTANRPRLPGPITFRDEQGKSLCDIVSRLSLTIDDTKSLKDRSLDFFNKKRPEPEKLQVESTIDVISSPSLRRKERVNLMISQALWNTRETELIELYSGKRGEVEGSNLSTESVEKLKTWGSIKSFTSRGNDSSAGAFSTSTLSQDQRTDIIEKLSERNLSLEQNSSANRGLEEFPRLSENPLQERKNILTKIDINESPKPILSESKEDLKNSSSSRISLSGKNSRNKLKKKSGTRCSKRKSSHRVRGKRGKKLSSSSIPHNTEAKLKSSAKEKFQNSSGAATPDEKSAVAAKRVDPSFFPAELPEFKRREESNQDGHYLLQKPQKSKLELLKSRFASGLFLQQNATAKPSRTVIPQSSRARAIFRPLAGIQEPEEPKSKDIKKPLVEPPKPKNRTTPRPSNPVWRPGGSPPGRAPSSRSPSVKPQKKTPSSKEEAKSPILRSRTFVSKDPKTEDTSKKEVESPKRSRNSEPLRILKEILSIKEETSKPSRIPTIKSSQGSLKTSKILIEKLAKSSDISIPSVCSRSVTKKLYRTSQDFHTQTLKIVGRSQGLQTVPEIREQFHVFTETESRVPAMIDAQGSYDAEEKERKKSLMDAGVSCSLSTTSLSKKKVELKVFRVIETQTSRSLLICGGKKDVSLETLRMNFPCKEVNTDKNVLIDSATGKDKLEINNFSCNSQLTNTELFFHSPINSVANQVDSIKSIVNIDIDNNSMNSIVSTISSELVSSKKCLIDSCKKFSSEILHRHDEIIKIPEEVIRAFEIAADRAQNLYRAIEIYHEKILNTNSINSNLQIIENFDKSCEDNYSDLEGLIIQQEVQIVIEDIMNAVDEKLNYLNNEILINCKNSKNSSKLFMKRGNILPIVYGALCSFVFWSLQFSMSCDLT